MIRETSTIARQTYDVEYTLLDLRNTSVATTPLRVRIFFFFYKISTRNHPFLPMYSGVDFPGVRPSQKLRFTICTSISRYEI